MITTFITACWVVFVIYWLISATKAKSSIRSKALQYNIWFRMGFVVLFIIILNIPSVSRFFTTHPVIYTPWLALLGAILCFSGLAFAIWARVHIGKNWGMPMTMRNEPELVTTGPYSLVRHPIYSGVLLAMVGSALAGGTFWFIIFIFFFLYFLFSALTEEKLMAGRFPGQYEEYKRKTKRLVPFIF